MEFSADMFVSQVLLIINTPHSTNAQMYPRKIGHVSYLYKRDLNNPVELYFPTVLKSYRNNVRSDIQTTTHWCTHLINNLYQLPTGLWSRLQTSYVKTWVPWEYNESLDYLSCLLWLSSSQHRDGSTLDFLNSSLPTTSHTLHLLVFRCPPSPSEKWYTYKKQKTK